VNFPRGFFGGKKRPNFSREKSEKV